VELFTKKDVHFFYIPVSFIGYMSVAMKFPQWLYCSPHTCTLTACWEESPSKYSPWATMNLAQRYCHCWKHFWNFS